MTSKTVAHPGLPARGEKGENGLRYRAAAARGLKPSCRLRGRGNGGARGFGFGERSPGRL